MTRLVYRCTFAVVAMVFCVAVEAADIEGAVAARGLCMQAINLLKSDRGDTPLRQTATQIVERLLDQASGEQALPLLDGPRRDDVTAQCLARAFARIGYRPAGTALAGVVLDAKASMPTRRAALQALKALRDRTVVPAMRSRLTTGNRSERIFSATVLVTLGDEAGDGESALLTEMSRTPESDLASWQDILTALTEARSKAAVPEFLRVTAAKGRPTRDRRQISRLALSALLSITLCEMGSSPEARAAWWEEHRDAFRPLRATGDDAPLLVAKLNVAASRRVADAVARLLRESGSEALPALRAGLRTPDVDVSRIVPLLGALGERGVPALVEALGVSREAARVATVHLSAQKELALPLLKKAVFQGDPAARTAALRALGRIGDGGCESAIVKGLEDTEASVQLAARTALAELRLRTGEPGEREEAALLLGGLTDQRDVGLLLAAVSDPAPKVASAAVEALGTIGSRPCIAAVMAAAEHRQPEVAMAAIITCGRIASRRTLSVVVAAMKSDRPELKEAAFMAIEERGRGAVVPDVLRILRTDRSSSQRRAAALALAELDEESAVPHIIAAMGRDQADARRDYQDALVMLTGQEGLRTVEDWQRWWEQRQGE